MSAGALIGVTLIVALAGAVPWVQGDAAVAAAAILAAPGELGALVACCAVAQMSAKLALYALVRWMPERMPRRARPLMSRARAYRRRRGVLVLTIASGAAFAIPPFYLVTLACAAMRVPVALFAAVGLGGTITRYALLVWAARAIASG